MFNKTEMLGIRMGNNERHPVPRKKGFMSSDEIDPLEPAYKSRWGGLNRRSGFTPSDPLAEKIGKPIRHKHLISKANRDAAMRAAKLTF